METRKKLVRAARQLFISQGYDNTTLEEIAHAAGLHVQTLYRHFGTKQDLARAGDIYWLELFEEAIEKRDRTQSTFKFWRDWMSETIDHLLEERDNFREHLKINFSTPTVLGASMEVRNRYENLLAEHLAMDFGLSADGVSSPRLVACMLVAGNAFVRSNFAEQDLDIKADTLKVIDMATEMFSHLIKIPQTDLKAV